MSATLTPDPFGEPPPPFWRRMLVGDRSDLAPRRYAWTAGVVGGILSLSLGGAHHNLVVAAIFSAITALPAVLVQRWWRQRRRRESEALIVLPASTDSKHGQAS